MLPAGQTYRATIYHDGDDADWQTRPYDCVLEEADVTSADTLHMYMASGGGFALSLIP
jgi:alpha-glucosidase